MAHSVFRAGHSTLNRALGTQIDDPQKLEAFFNGMAAYEAATSLVHPQRDLTTPSAAARYVLPMDELLSAPECRRTLRDAHDEFTYEMPNTSLLIASLALSIHDNFTVAGAAVARKIQLDTINDFSAFERQFEDFEF